MADLASMFGAAPKSVFVRRAAGLGMKELQWGRGLATAEWKEMGQQTLQQALLQWGRGHVTAECLLSYPFNRRGPSASMGPRSRDRGVVQKFLRRAIALRRFNGAAVT